MSKPPGSSRWIRRPQHCGVRAARAAALPGLGDTTPAESPAPAQASHVPPVPGGWCTWVCNMCAPVRTVLCPGTAPGNAEFPRLQPQVMGGTGRQGQEGKFLPCFQGDGEKWEWGQSCLCQVGAGSLGSSLHPSAPWIGWSMPWLRAGPARGPSDEEHPSSRGSAASLVSELQHPERPEPSSQQSCLIKIIISIPKYSQAPGAGSPHIPAHHVAMLDSPWLLPKAAP